MSVTATDVTEETFEKEVVERSREKPVVVDFWADWCGPCHALAPVLEREIESRGDAVTLAKVDVDANQALAASYRVQGIPAVKGFRDGRVVAEFVGAQSPAAVSSFLDGLLAPPAIEGALEDLRASGEHADVLQALEAGDPERALELILERIPSALPDERERLRGLAVAIFDDLGQDDPIATAYRRRLATVLY
jgi:putative thioredoxin